MPYCIISPPPLHCGQQLRAFAARPAGPGHRVPRARRACPADRPEPAAQTQLVRPGDARRPGPRLRRAGIRPVGAGRRAVRARRPLHRRSGSRRRRPRASRPGSRVSGRRPRSLAAGRRLDHTAGRRRARLVHDAGHRIAAGRRHSHRGGRHPVHPARGAARPRAGSTRSAARRSACPRGRLGQRHALAAHRRRVRRRRGAPHRVGPGGGRRRGAALARAREIAHTIADRAAPLGVRATLASAHLARTRARRPRSSSCVPPSPSCSPARTPPRACSRSSNDGRPASTGR